MTADVFTDYVGLDKHENRATRTDSFATISAGYKNDKGIPVVSRNGVIHIADPENRAPGLARALAKSGGMRLTIAMPGNDPAQFISESFRLEGKTRLEAFGDANGITTISGSGERRHHAAGSPEFKRLREECKVSTSILFLLAEYDKQGRPLIVYPDGMGLYRLRTTSPNTRDNLMSQLRLIAKMTGGHVAGFPLEVSIAYRNLAGPKGDKRNCPVFVFALKPPQEIQLDSRQFAQIASAARETMSLGPTPLMLAEAVAGSETLETALADFDAPPPAALLTGLNPEQFRRRFFKVCQDTHMDSDPRRKHFVFWYTKGVTPSLATFLDGATPDEAEAMYDALVDVIKRPAIDFKTGEVLAVSPVEAKPFAGEAFGMPAPITVDAVLVDPAPPAPATPPAPGEPSDEDLANGPPAPVMPMAEEVMLPIYEGDDEDVP